MGFKKAILAILLLIILTMGAASAADNSTDNLMSAENATEDFVSIENNDEEIIRTGEGSFEDLTNDISAVAENGTLTFTRDYAFGATSERIVINKSMTIDGQGHTIDCKKARNLFLVYDDNVVLKNIKFANCKSDGFDGSAIHWYGNAGILENCSFENCTSAMDTSENAPNGGAIYWYGNNGRISNCSFEKCSAILLGGAIYWRGLNGSVSDCSFVKCSSVSSIETYTAGLASDGGAVYWAGINGTLSNCSFKECSASDKGDAIYWNGLNGTATGCSIVKFSTDEYGAVYWSGNNGDLTNCSFMNCSSTAYYGGVLYWTGVNGSIADCGFDSITGCAVHLFADNGNVCGSDFKNLTKSGIHVEGVNGTVINCSFENCSTSGSGSAIDWRGINGSLINCGFINCSSNNLGGAVLWACEGGAILNSTFKDCFAFSNYGWGGAIKLTGSNCNVSECNFEGCHADGEGGAIYLTGNDCNVSGCNFEGCDADSQGGAICWEGSNGTVSSCSFENCSAGSTTGAIIWLNGNSKGQIEYSNFTNCYAPNTKAIYTSNEKLGIYSCIFEDNTTNDLNDLVSASNITQCILNGNPIKKDLVMNLTASEIIYGEEEIVIVSFPADATGNVTLSLADMIVTKFPVDGIINYNFPNLDAGAYAVTATYSGDDNYYPSNRTVNFIVNRKPSILSIVTTYDEYLTLLVNLTAGYGNVTININNESFFTIEITNGTYVLNIANMTPGSYYFTAEFLGNDNYEAAYVDTILTINATDTFKNLQDLIDAAGDELNLTSNFTYADGDTSVTINKPITINGNGYTINAKTIVGFKIKSDNVNLINITFLNGYNSMEHGGAIIWEGNGGSITNCSFTGCGCDGYGAAVSWQGANGLVSNCSFTDCNALNSGGSIHWSGANGRISNCEFTNSRSGYQGGAIFWQASDGRIEDSVFTTFKSTSQGNAIYITNNDVVVSGCDFEDACYDSIDTVVYGGQLLGYTLNGIRHKNVDLEISLLTNANGTLEIGDPFNINVTVHNSGSDDATGAYVSLSLPSSIVVTSANTLTGEYSYNGTIWDIGNLGADQTATLTLTAYSIQSGNITITSTTDASQSDANSSNDMAQIQISVLDANTFEYLNALIEAAGDTLILTKDYYSTGNQIEISKSITIDGKSHTLDAKCLSRVLNIKSDGVTLKNIIFRNAFIAGVNNGGAINNGGYNGNIFNCSFVNCSAGQSAGAVGGYGDESIFANCSFINCSSADHSGAVDWAYDCNIFNSTFVNCSGRYGGAIACGWLGDNSLLYNCTFVNCSSSSSVDSGGAIWFVGSYLCNVVKCSFVNCSSKGEGGGIYFYGEGNISDSSFENCHASQGGAIYFNNGGNGYNCNFTNCSADNNGGAVYWTGNNGKIESSNFIKCNAENGRAIYVSEGRTVNILKSKFDNADSIYGGTISNCTFGEKTNPDMTVTVSDITIGENLIVNVTMVNDSPQAVYLNIFKADTLVDWVHITASAFDGHADWEFSNLKIGEYLLNVEFVGDEKYESATCNMTFTVRPKVVVPEIVPEATNMNIYMDFGENITDTIVIKIDKKTFDVLNIKQGIVNESTKTVYFSTGNHIATFSYEGDLFDANLLNHMGSPIEYNIEIVPVEIPIEEEIETGTDGVFTIEVPINATGKLTIFIDGQAVQTLDVEEEIAKFLYETQGQVIDITVGILKIDLSKYKGKFTVTFEYSGDENFHAFTKEANVTVSNPSITATPTKALYTAGQTYTIKVYIATGILAGKEKVIVKVNGKSFKTLTTTNGIATFKITQTPGTYKLKITSLGKTVTKTLTVKHIVTLKTVKIKKSAKKLILQATLAKVNKKYLKNKQIIFKFNGKKYKAKTNKKGVAKVTIKKSILKKLKVGKKITYQATYLKDTVKKTAKVKK